ncbi:Bestrophin-3 [Bulinus truncatus]|nr:Bestrophin-3 [Bulinus truncatus]
MTIIYQNRVATTSLGGFLKLLRAWRGSVYKLMFKELIIFCVLYLVISLIYRLALPEEHKRVFERMAIELRAASSIIPLSFILGFYVSFIVERWWQQFLNVPWPDRTLFVMATYLHGTDDRSRMMRRAVARYIMFGLILICRNVSVSVMKRFPTLDHIVAAGFVTKEEIEMYDKVKCKYIKFWVPMVWANQILVTARREGRIQTDFGLRMIIEYLADIRDKCSIMFVYDWITVPLVYTQVVTFAVYSYFAVSLIGQQYLDPGQKYEGYEGDFYFPGFTILQFLFYMGWLKVAEQMINPFGEDDDDFDINWLLDRHTDVAFCLSDQCYGFHPPFIQDGFWGDVTREIPYTEASLGSFRPNFMGTTYGILNPELEAEQMIFPEHEESTPLLKSYKHRQEFAADMRLIFNNCETFNEDDSDVGQAGFNMRQYFERRWLDMFPDDAP